MATQWSRLVGSHDFWTAQRCWSMPLFHQRRACCSPWRSAGTALSEDWLLCRAIAFWPCRLLLGHYLPRQQWTWLLQADVWVPETEMAGHQQSESLGTLDQNFTLNSCAQCTSSSYYFQGLMLRHFGMSFKSCCYLKCTKMRTTRCHLSHKFGLA